MAKKTTKQRAEAYLKKTGSKAVYATQDGFLFKQKQDAVSHARGIDKKEVSTFTLDAKASSKEDNDANKDKATAGKKGQTENKTTTAGNQGNKSSK